MKNKTLIISIGILVFIISFAIGPERCIVDLDSDDDGINNKRDNCPEIYNPEQEDDDNDNIGNACDDCTDQDGDNYGIGIGCLGSDCNDNDKNINPGEIENCDNKIDDNCDGVIDCHGEVYDFRDSTIYFLFTDRFVDGDSSNNYETSETWGGTHGYQGGDFKGIIENLDYIKGMGFNTLWITPIIDNPEYRYYSSDTTKNQESGYHGYWGKDFTKVDEHLESRNVKYKDLVESVHNNNMKLIVDVVLNHASPAYYFRDCPPETCGCDDYPLQLGEVWENGKKIHDHGPYPTDPKCDKDNWFHHNCVITDYTNQYQVENCDLEYLADFNTENPNVVKWLYDTYTYWQSYGVDGFRLDALKHIPREPFWINFANLMLSKNPNFFMFGEVFNGDPGGDYSPTYYTYKSDGTCSNIGMLDFPLYFKIQEVFVYKGPYSSINWVLDRDDWYCKDKKTGKKWSQYLVTFIDNHDVPRFKGDQTDLMDALNLLFTIRGIPSLYFGTEVEHLKNTQTDKEGRGYYGKQNINNAPNHPVYKHIVKLNGIRKNNIALRRGEMTRLPVIDSYNTFAYSREYEGNYVVVALNKGGNWGNFDFYGIPNGKYVDAMSGYSIEVKNGNFKFGVSPHSVAIYVRQ